MNMQMHTHSIISSFNQHLMKTYCAPSICRDQEFINQYMAALMEFEVLLRI